MADAFKHYILVNCGITPDIDYINRVYRAASRYGRLEGHIVIAGNPQPTDDGVVVGLFSDSRESCDALADIIKKLDAAKKVEVKSIDLDGLPASPTVH